MERSKILLARCLVLYFLPPKQKGSKLSLAYGMKASVKLITFTDMIRFPNLALTYDHRAEALDADVEEFHTYAKQYESTVYAVTVGSESLYRYYHETDGHTTGLSNEELNSAINNYTAKMADIDVKFPVGTADSWNVYNDGTADVVIQNTNVTIL